MIRFHWIYAFLIRIFSIDKIYTTCYSITIVYLVSLKNYLQTNIAKAIIYAEFSIITINPKVITIRQRTLVLYIRRCYNTFMIMLFIVCLIVNLYLR